MERKIIKYAFQGEKEEVLGYFGYTNKNEPKLVIPGDLAEGLEKIANMNTARISINGKQCNYQDFKEEINKCEGIISE